MPNKNSVTLVPEISFVIINYNGKNLLEQCLLSIYNSVKDIIFEIIVVDDGSTDGSSEMVLQKFPYVKLIRNEKELFSDECLNKGINEAKGKYIHFLMPDTKLMPNTEEQIVKFLDDNPDVAAVTSRLVYPDGRFQQSATRDHTLVEILLNYTFLGKIFPKKKKEVNYYYTYGDIKDWTKVLEIENTGLTNMVVRKEVFEKIGLMDTGMKMYFAENDLCIRIRKNCGKIFYLPYGEIVHHLRGVVKSSGIKKIAKIYEQDTIQYVKKYFGLLWMLVFIILVKISNILISLRERKPTYVVESFLVNPEK